MAKQEDTKRRVKASQEKEAGSKVEPGKSWFFGIGIDRYQDSEISDLRNAVADVKQLARLLEDRYDVKEAKLLLDEDATRQNILRYMEHLEEKVEEEDKIIIFFGGHGHVHGRSKKGYWIPHDATLDDRTQYIHNSTIRDSIENIRSRHTLLIADSCFSGALLLHGLSRSTVAIDKLDQKPSRWVMCSGRGDELVEDGGIGGHSPFTSSILKALRENDLPRLNVGKIIDPVMELTAAKTGSSGQIPVAGPLRVEGHLGGQYIFVMQGREESFWQECNELGRITCWDLYLQKYPNGKYRSQAIASIIAREQEDAAAWAKLLQNETIGTFWDYLERFPDGRFRTLAETRLEKLRRFRSTTGSGSGNTEDSAGLDKRYNDYIDPRSGQVYKTTELNGQTWLAENFKFEVEDSWHYLNDPKNGEDYGRLYTWEAAQKACPPGWRLPTDKDWLALTESFGDYQQVYKALVKGGSSGFDAVIGGCRFRDGSFDELGELGYYWSNRIEGSDKAKICMFSDRRRSVVLSEDSIAFGQSCRYVKD